jgi:hypothetical protein
MAFRLGGDPEEDILSLHYYFFPVRAEVSPVAQSKFSALKILS